MTSESNQSNGTKLGFARLGERNYPSWSVDMSSYLRMKKVWRIVTGDRKAPSVGAPDYMSWLEDSDSALGIIISGLEMSQRIHVKGIDDPVKMWEALKHVHQQKNAATRFNAYEALFNIQKLDEESLPALCARVESAMAAVKDMHPDAFTIDDLDDDLSSTLR